MNGSKGTSLSPGSRALAALFGVVIVLIVFVHCRYLISISLPIPFQDDWRVLTQIFASRNTSEMCGFVFGLGNGHFAVPGKLAYLISWRFFAFDLSLLRLANIPVCLGAFILFCAVTYRHTSSWLVRSYLGLGAAFIIFNLSFWEHFTVAGDFTALLSALLGVIALYLFTKALLFSEKRYLRLSLAGGLFLCSIMSFGVGYAALCAGGVFLGIFSVAHQGKFYRATKSWLPVTSLSVVAGVCLISHPAIFPRSGFLEYVFHGVLVAGSLWSIPFDSPLLAQEVAYVCGLILLVGSSWIALDFLYRDRRRLLPAFGLALVLFGAIASFSVSVARAQLPNPEFLSPRYTLEPSLALIGAMFYFVSWHKLLLTHVWCFISIAYLFGTIKESGAAPYRVTILKAEADAMKHLDSLSDQEVAKLFFWRDPTIIRKVTARLRSQHLNVFKPQS